MSDLEGEAAAVPPTTDELLEPLADGRLGSARQVENHLGACRDLR